MKYRTILALLALSLAACSSNDSNGGNTNNGTAGTNNGTAGTNNGTAGTNNGTAGTNNGTAGTNNGTAGTNNATTGTNNGTTGTNNATVGDLDYISADVDGVEVVASAEEGGIEPMGDTVQFRKTTGEATTPILIFRLIVPNTDVASYDCATDGVSVMYTELNGQFADTWETMDTCTIAVTQSEEGAGGVVAGTFTATATNGLTSKELTNGEFSLTR